MLYHCSFFILLSLPWLIDLGREQTLYELSYNAFCYINYIETNGEISSTAKSNLNLPVVYAASRFKATVAMWFYSVIDRLCFSCVYLFVVC